MIKENLSLVQKAVVKEYDEEGEIKKYPSLELVRIEKKFFNIHSSNAKVLEYGFGGGCNTEALLDQGYQVFGIDVSKAAFNTTKRRFIGKEDKIKGKLNLSLIDSTTSRIDFEDNSFDYIVAMSVLSLLGSEQRIKLLLREFKRVLKEGGRIVLDINDQDSEFSKGKKEVEKNVFLAGPYGDNIHCYCLKTENDFKDLIKEFFEIKDSGYSCHKLFGRRINEWIICAEKK
jgi:ubiquinone/menaquinone biosynthesis C-methylase UbiE